MRKKEESLDNLLKDAIRVFLLVAATECMLAIQENQPDRALWALEACAITCYQFLTSDDPSYNQAVKYTERILTYAARSKSCNPHIEKFKNLAKKMKTAIKDLKPTDIIQGMLPDKVLKTFDEYDKRDEEMADIDLWTTESICFRYFNLLQEFKTKKQVSQVTCAFTCTRTGLTGTLPSKGTDALQKAANSCRSRRLWASSSPTSIERVEMQPIIKRYDQEDPSDRNEISQDSGPARQTGRAET